SQQAGRGDRKSEARDDSRRAAPRAARSVRALGAGTRKTGADAFEDPRPGGRKKREDPRIARHAPAGVVDPGYEARLPVLSAAGGGARRDRARDPQTYFHTRVPRKDREGGRPLALERRLVEKRCLESRRMGRGARRRRVVPDLSRAER